MIKPICPNCGSSKLKWDGIRQLYVCQKCGCRTSGEVVCM